MKWLRSAEMEYISLIVNEDAAHDCVQKLGDLGVLEFTDLNPELTPFQRRYVNYVKRCDEMERKLRYFEVELGKFSILPNLQVPLLFTRFSLIGEPLVDPGNGQPVTKHAFVIFFQSSFIENKLRKICDAFRARLYSLPPMDDRTAIAHLI